ncbi:tetratricopeptide repeat protein [Phormidium sp. CLA17]|uniref:tetratricopeptide repeat protein n=1 Tax=Leptolyngbya sp. Cla-17 TaxID=2803751 RepID=UPI001492BCBD|nr:tetratricopeptide repeat protein [Leptolyngbya sp. Cla-17]MBM0741575.1 tetratricopeptide repeat protein [Leptolyngbya sp. Cla-17]
MNDRYLDLIDRIIAATLKGEIRSKDQVYEMLQAEVSPGTGELFERCLQERVEEVQAHLKSTDELLQAKATRKQRALKTIQGEWERWQKNNQSSSSLTKVVQAIATQPPEERLSQLLDAIDPNQAQVLTREQIGQLAELLQQAANKPDAAKEFTKEIADFAAGLHQGLKTWQELEVNVVGWIFEQNQGSLGFGGSEQLGPWSSWAKSVRSPGLKALFNDLAQQQAVTAEGVPSPTSVTDWVEWAIALQRLQLGLVGWFDKQPYDATAGKRLSIATFLTFTAVWSQLSQRFSQLNQPILAQGCFQMALQSLYYFAQQPYYPLYGGLFAALSGEPLQTTLDYLDQPLRQVPNTASKARILTLLGYSQRALGQVEQALKLHQQALEIAREAGDRSCEIANLNHLSRAWVMQNAYAKAIDTSQRALILARQTGDRLGEANALTNLGSTTVAQGQAEITLDADQYEQVLGYLQRGLRLSEQEGDVPSQALCTNSLGIAQVMLEQYPEAIASLEKGLRIAQAIGDLSLQGLNCTYMAEAHRGLGNSELAIYTGCLGMYLLNQIGSHQWRQPAGILSILNGQMGAEAFQAVLTKYRPQFLQIIGVDGFDYLPTLLINYRSS